MSSFKHRFKEGDKVRYKPLGEDRTIEVTIIDAAFEEFWYGNVAVYDLNNGHWCYDNQVIELIGE